MRIATSLVIAACNEPMLSDTIASARQSLPSVEVVVVDDASTEPIQADCGADVVIRHDSPLGVANSRLDGAEAASGDVYVFADAHHEFEADALSVISEHAATSRAIAWGRVLGLGKSGNNPRSGACRGGLLAPCQDEGKKGIIGNHWMKQRYTEPLVRAHGLFVAYAIHREAFELVKWSRLMSGYGGHEAAIAVRAYFTETQIFYLHGSAVRHLFRKSSPFSRDGVKWWRNHALTCRICFSDETWQNYWMPVVFAGHVDRFKLTDELNGKEVLAAHDSFQSLKRRRDADFWRGLYHEQPPRGVR